jgi:HNH endonuclease
MTLKIHYLPDDEGNLVPGKRCSKCTEVKPLYEFNKRSDSQHYRSHCKGCVKEKWTQQEQSCLVVNSVGEKCMGRAKHKGMCGAHYSRWLKHGDVKADLPLKASPGSGYITKGYKAYNKGSRKIFEHRLVMEEILGRQLLPEENVHHKNGNRLDNRPENLELWSTSQPNGQRVEDKLAWARQIIALYGEVEIAKQKLQELPDDVWDVQYIRQSSCYHRSDK